jgi:glyoxylase-like metal-dependent hydrolase (beta-lactamase superfamily II)
MGKRITYNSTNFFLEPCKDGYLLVDAGWHGKLGKFRQSLADLNIGLNEIKYIVLTHHHHDHAALVQDLKGLTQAKLIVHERQVEYISKGITDYKKIRQCNRILWLLDKMLRPFIHFSYKPISVEPSDYILKDEIDEEILRSIGIEGKIVSTPGHSSDSISVVLDNGTAYVGDLAMNIMGLVGNKPFPIEAEDYSQVNSSLRKLIQMGVIDFYPSHGSAFNKKLVLDRINI